MAKPTKQMMEDHDMAVLNKLEVVDNKQFMARAMAILSHEEFKNFSIFEQLEIMSQVKAKAEERFSNSPEAHDEIMQQVEKTAALIKEAISTGRRSFTDQLTGKMIETGEYDRGSNLRVQAFKKIQILMHNLGNLKKFLDVRQGVFASNTMSMPGEVAEKGTEFKRRLGGVKSNSNVDVPGQIPLEARSQTGRKLRDSATMSSQAAQASAASAASAAAPALATEEKTKILIYSDFDGTVTGKPGNKAVFSDFYKALFANLNHKDYRTWPIRDSAAVQALFKAQFDNPDADKTFFMSDDAVAFFKQALSQPDCRVNIITKNRDDYVKELFKFHGFSEQEIDRITIDTSGLKKKAVTQDLRNIDSSEVEVVLILDDVAADFKAMRMAVQEASFEKEPSVVAHNEGAGQFNWKGYLEHITRPGLESNEGLSDSDGPEDETVNSGPSM